MNSRKKKLCRILLLTVLMICSLSFSVFAATIEVSTIDELKNALEGGSGDTIKLSASIDLGTNGTFTEGTDGYHGVNVTGKGLVLDLNGQTITSACNRSTITIAEGASLTIEGEGRVTNSVVEGYVLRNRGELTINGGTYESATSELVYALFPQADTTTLINGGTFNGVIATNGLVSGTNITIKGGTFTRLIYLAADGECTIEGGNFSVDTATVDTDNDSNAVIEIKRGKLNIIGGTFEMNIDTSNVNSLNPEINKNGSGAFKGTILVTKADGYEGDTEVTVTGGEFKNASGDVFAVANEVTSGDKVTLSIENATVTGDITQYGSGKEEISLSGGKIEEIDPVAEVAGSKFDTIEEAMSYAVDNDTIKLLATIDLGAEGLYSESATAHHGLYVEGKTLILDLNGQTITSACNKATITVAEGASLTIEGEGRVTNSVVEGYVLRNRGELTINGGTYESATSEFVYALFPQADTTTLINGGTFNGVIATNGLVSGTNITIKDGTFTRLIYLAADGEYTIEGGNFSVDAEKVDTDNDSNAVIEIKRGKLNITGGTFEMNIDTSNVNSLNPEINKNGSGAFKGTILVTKADGYEGDTEVTITGGTFINNLGDAFAMANETLDYVTTLDISGDVSGDISYYGMISEEEQNIITQNDIILRGQTAQNNVITVNKGSELKEELVDGDIRRLVTEKASITYVFDNGEEDKVVYGGYDEEVPAVENPTKTGYEFVEWTPAVPETFSGDVTVTATWKICQYTLTFVYGNGAENKEVSGDYGSTIPAEADPTRTGYIFAGWDKEIPTTMPAEDMTITATWTERTYSSGGGGSSVTKYKITVNQTEGGKISPNTISVEKRDNQKFEIKPSKGYEITDVLVDGVSVGVVTEYKFENVTEKHTITAKFAKIDEEKEEENKEENKEEESTWSNLFTDVAEKEWYFEAVKFVSENGLFNGVSENEFAPNQNLTRGMLVTVLYRHAKADVKNSSGFGDVKETMYYSAPIAWAAENGIVNGLGDNLFAPDKEITREQLATILYRYAKYLNRDVSVGEDTNILSYDDFSNISEYSIAAFQWACGSSVINGRTESTLAPQETATRAEVATMLMRFCQ